MVHFELGSKLYSNVGMFGDFFEKVSITVEFYLEECKRFLCFDNVIINFKKIDSVISV